MKLDSIDLELDELKELGSPDKFKSGISIEDTKGFIYPLFFDPYHEINP